MFNMIQCKICNKECRGQISGSHLKTHGLTVKQYESLYGASRDPALILACKTSGKNGGSNARSVATLKAKAFVRKDEYDAKPRNCLICDSLIPYEKDSRQKYCSLACSAKAPRSKRGGKGRAIKNCVVCDHPVTHNSTFCGGTCKAKFDLKNLIDQWVNNEITGGTEIRLNPRIRSYLIEQANHACTLCGWDKINPKTGNCPLHIDHVNGDCTDHRPKNLRVICPNCHSLTETYGALNRDNKGRTVRRKERIANGLSYDPVR